MDSTKSITRSARQFFSGTLISRITGFLRDITMAYTFGATAEVAALFVAYRLAHLLRRLFGEGALQTAFIPQFEHLRHEDPERAKRFYRDLTFSLSILLIIIIVLSMGILSFFSNEIADLTFLLMPSLLFICLFGLNAAYLQCQKSYFLPGVAPVAFNLIWIIGALMTDSTADLASIIVIGCFAQWLITLPKTYPSFKNISLFSPDLRLLAKPLFLGILGVGAAQINSACDALFARVASPEGPAYLWYAIRIQQLPLALFGIALSGALLPPLTRAFKENQIEKFNQLLRFAATRITALMVPITIGIFIFGQIGISLIYGHGDFSVAAADETYLCLIGYSLGLIPMALILILAPSFYAKKDWTTPTLASTISVLVNLVLNALFINVFRWGPASVALATSLAAWVNLALLWGQKKAVHNRRLNKIKS